MNETRPFVHMNMDYIRSSVTVHDVDLGQLRVCDVHAHHGDCHQLSQTSVKYLMKTRGINCSARSSVQHPLVISIKS